MPNSVEVENFSVATHRYEHGPTGVVYVWPAGETREVPEDVAEIVTRAHPRKLRYAHRMLDTQAPVELELGHRHYWRRDGSCRCGATRAREEG